ncbi:UNVERIFIED_CONTAM: UDP-glucosyltransferase 29 [Sesamum angustifolium]|uniref:UDP-glucosyltransferase 29 n=1 Tax=Sesamum angustifolium TaxID=2727405 RepID=A0AAW2NXU3_9LAMI
MEKEQPKFSILMFPWLAYSHVFPFLGLAKRLSKRSFHIYFCSSAINLDSIRNNMGTDLHIATASIDLIELQVPSLPELPSQFHTTKNLPTNLLPILLQAFQMSSSSFSEILNALKPDLLIYDFFQRGRQSGLYLKKKVVPTGPIVQEPNDKDDGCSEILQWLSKKERYSTVFVCFGSEHFLSKEQILEIAKGVGTM